MPDFGIMRGFNDKLFGDKLYAGQLPTQLGLIGSENFGFDSDAVAFFNRVTAAGGSLSATEQLAVDTLVKQMKLDGIWSLMKAIYPMVGASAAACAQNLKSSSFTGTFTSGFTFASTGVTGNGTSAFMNTGIVPSVDMDILNTSSSIYSRSDIDSASFASDLGTAEGSNALQFITRTGNIAYIDNFNSGGGFQAANTSSLGSFISQGNSSTIFLYKNGTLLKQQPAGVRITITKPIYIFARFGGLYSLRQLAFAHIGEFMDSTQTVNFYTAVQAFQTTLSRQV
jgi:hypothetical protein